MSTTNGNAIEVAKPVSVMGIHSFVQLPLHDLIRVSTAARLRRVRPSRICAMIDAGIFEPIIIDGVRHLLRSEVLDYQRSPGRPKGSKNKKRSSRQYR